MRRIAKGLAATVLTAAFLAGSWSRLAGPQSAAAGGIGATQAESAGARPDALGFTLQDMEGRAVELGRWRGRPVIIDFWATWCPPCRKQIPELKKLYARYHKSRGLAVIGVACDTVQGEGVAAVRPFVKEYAINYPIVMADDEVLDRLGVEAIPTTLFVSRDGELMDRLTGASNPGELTAAAKRLLAKPHAGRSRRKNPRRAKGTAMAAEGR